MTRASADVVIRASHLTKVYRLYAKPSYRFRDMFGLLRDKPGRFTEHAALDGVSLEIERGQKVAIIGRNGAGKSTFLKLVTHVIEPTSGQLEVSGKVHALLQIGTGFHPDFTGRENVYAYLAQLGVTGEQARRRCAEVIDFAELEEYIDQPIKTYSTGMSVRLMFSASTAITPDLLVLDEVLGVGDAYFAQKSFDRMRDLCTRNGTTLLLVTHDVYSAVKLCERVIWIDRGRVLLDGLAADVVKAYEDSIRQQEEARLRAKTRVRLEQIRAAKESIAAVNRLFVEVRPKSRIPQPSPVFFSRIELCAANEVMASLPLGDDDAFDESRPSHLTREGSSWGDAVALDGRSARAFLNYGSPFHKVAGVFSAPLTLHELTDAGASIRLSYRSDAPCDLTLHVLTGNQEWALGSLAAASGAWVDHEVRLSDAVETTSTGVAPVQGTGRIRIDHVEVRDEAGVESHFLEHGRAARVVLHYNIADAGVAERAQVVVAFHRGGVANACRIIARHLMFDASVARSGHITLSLPKVVLGAGEYSVTVMVVAEGYYDRVQTIFYSINPEVYCCLNRVLEITVTGGGLIASGTAFVGDGVWTIEPAADEAAPLASSTVAERERE
jgi:homopolymeric O-antigen transport system ATP-binding protein